MTEKRWVTFDCFGTLVDWRHGIATSLELLWPGRGDAMLESYNRHERLVQHESPGMRYRRVLAESLRRAAADQHLTLLDDDAEILSATIPFWPVYADVRPALGALREAGWNLALLTNCDRDLIAATRRRLQVPFDAVVTAEDVGAYKPAHDHFRRFEQSFGVTRDRWVHVAQSYVHDIVPASELGVVRVWVNRRRQSDDPSLAHAVCFDLGELPAVVGRLHETGA